MFLGSYNYYGHFVHQFADISDPLYALLYKEAIWHWTNIVESAINSLCTALCSHPVLALLEYTKPFQIESDASDTAVSSVITQEHAYIHKHIAFLNNTSTNSEKKYSIHDCELFSIVTYCKAWRY